ncbi:hypothetical protein PspS34_16385 [Pseudomonas sp. S34]|nr:hypothetical protein PspS34_16385 [Pseudomonas sp. S34]
MEGNDDAGNQTDRGALGFCASRLAPTGGGMWFGSESNGPARVAGPKGGQSFGNCPMRPIISVTICKSSRNCSVVLNSLSL